MAGTPLESYADKPFALDGLPTVVDAVDQRGRGVYEDYLQGVLWPSQTIANEVFYSAGRVIQHPDTLTRSVFTVSATAAIDSMRYSVTPDEEIAARCVQALIEEPDAFAPVDHVVHPRDGRELVMGIFQTETAHNPELASLASGVELAFTPSFDQLLTGPTTVNNRNFERVAEAAQLGVAYGAAMLRSAWEAAIREYSAIPDYPELPPPGN